MKWIVLIIGETVCPNNGCSITTSLSQALLSDQAEVLLEEAEELMSLLPQDAVSGNRN